MHPQESLSDLPSTLANVVGEAEEAGAAVLVFDRNDRIMHANEAQRAMMPVCEYGPGDTYTTFFWGAVRTGGAGNSSAKADPEAWLRVATLSRRASPSLDFVNDYAWGRAHCSNLRADNGMSIQLRVNISASEIGRYLEAQAVGVGAVWALQKQREVSALRGALDALGLAVAIVGQNGCVAFQNASFRELTEQDDGLVITADGALATECRADCLAFGQALDDASIRGASTYIPLRRSRGAALMAAVAPGAHDGTAVVTVSRFGEDGPEITSALKQIFSITPAEAAVMAALGGGASVQDLAERRGTSEGTIYNQVARIKNVMKRSEFAASSLGGIVGLVQRIAAITRADRRIH